MGPDDRDALEGRVRARCQQGDVEGAAEAAIRGYGLDIHRFLLALHRGDEEDAGEVLSQWCERLWRSLPEFGWACSLRTWGYTLARNLSANHQREARRRQRRQRPLSETARLHEIEQQLRSTTAAYRRTEVKSRMAEIRATLPPEDQVLLTLRIDQQMDWKELARVLLGEEAPAPEAITRESQRLRKRFQLLKERLVKLARERGVLGPREE